MCLKGQPQEEGMGGAVSPSTQFQSSSIWRKELTDWFPTQWITGHASIVTSINTNNTRELLSLTSKSLLHAFCLCEMLHILGPYNRSFTTNPQPEYIHLCHYTLLFMTSNTQ